MIADVSLSIGVDDLCLTHERDMPKAVVWAPPALKNCLTRSQYLFAMDIVEFYVVLGKLCQVPWHSQHVHAEQVVHGAVDCVRLSGVLL